MIQIDWVEELEKKKKEELLGKTISFQYSDIDENGNIRYKIIDVPNTSFKKYLYWGSNAA